METFLNNFGINLGSFWEHVGNMLDQSIGDSHVDMLTNMELFRQYKGSNENDRRLSNAQKTREMENRIYAAKLKMEEQEKTRRLLEEKAEKDRLRRRKEEYTRLKSTRKKKYMLKNIEC